MVKNQYGNLRKKGLNSAQIAQIYAIAHEEIEKAKVEMVERAFFYTLTIPLNVLVDAEIITRENAESYITDVIRLYQSVGAGVVSEVQLASLLKDYAGMDFVADWLNIPKENKDNDTN